jgi:amino acid transporter
VYKTSHHNVEQGVHVANSQHTSDKNCLNLRHGIHVYSGGSWMVLTSSIGVIYEFIAVSVFYWIIAASIAELASAIPSSGGVYHWASVTPGQKWGRVIGFYAGYWNWLAWVFGAASMSFIFCMSLAPFRM